MDRRPPLQQWLDTIKDDPRSNGVGILFVHNGVVRGTRRDGRAVANLEISYDPGLLGQAIRATEDMPGVVAAHAWINEGRLQIGDDMIYALVAGDTRTNVFHAWETLASRLKAEVFEAREILESGATVNAEDTL